MKRGIFILFFALVNLLFLQRLQAQDFEEDILKMSEHYQNVQNLKCEISIKVYESVNSTTPYYSDEAILKKKGDIAYAKMDNVEQLFTKDHDFLVFNDDKRIIVTETINNNNVSQNAPIDQIIDEQTIQNLITTEPIIEYIGKQNGNLVYEIRQENYYINKTILHLDQNDYHISYLEYYYDSKIVNGTEKVSINYSTYNLSPTFIESEFSHLQFVDELDEYANGVGNYTNYEVTYLRKPENK